MRVAVQENQIVHLQFSNLIRNFSPLFHEAIPRIVFDIITDPRLRAGPNYNRMVLRFAELFKQPLTAKITLKICNNRVKWCTHSFLNVA